MATARSLPAGFEDLEPFVATWALPATADRVAQRGRTTLAEKRAFYQVAGARLANALHHLDALDCKQLDGPDRRLFELVLSVAHISLAVERQKEADEALTLARALITVGKSVSDLSCRA